jgi:hypothetical protein
VGASLPEQEGGHQHEDTNLNKKTPPANQQTPSQVSLIHKHGWVLPLHPDPAFFLIADPDFCGSLLPSWIRIRIQQLKLMRIRIHNPDDY